MTLHPLSIDVSDDNGGLLAQLSDVSMKDVVVVAELSDITVEEECLCVSGGIFHLVRVVIFDLIIVQHHTNVNLMVLSSSFHNIHTSCSKGSSHRIPGAIPKVLRNLLLNVICG